MQQLNVDKNAEITRKPCRKKAYYALVLLLAALWLFFFIKENKSPRRMPPAGRSAMTLVERHIRSESTNLFPVGPADAGERR